MIPETYSEPSQTFMVELSAKTLAEVFIFDDSMGSEYASGSLELLKLFISDKMLTQFSLLSHFYTP